MKLSDQLEDVLGDEYQCFGDCDTAQQHFDQLAAAKVEKHVYWEKPWTLDAEGQTALEAFAKAGLKVAIGHN